MKTKVAFLVGLLLAVSAGVLAQISGGGVEGGGGQPSGNPFATQYKNGNRFGGTGPGTSGQVLTSRGASLSPTFQSISSPGSSVPTTVQGDTLFASAANTLSALAKDTNATRYLANTGTNNNPAWAQVNLANGVTGDLPFANLTQGSALSVLGVTGNATADVASIAAASDGNVLRRSGTAVGFGAIDVSSANAVSGILGAANGGTGNGFTAFTGPTTSTKTFTLPNASSTILTSNAAVTLAQGGTGLTTAADDTTLVSSGSAWVASAIPNCGSSTQALAYSTSTNAFSCQTVTGSGGGTGTTASPSCTANTNVDSCSATSNGMFYINVGTTVTGGFSVQIDPTSTGTTRVRVSIPVASNFGAVGDATGTCNTDTSTQTSAAVITGNATNDDLFITFSAAVTSNLSYGCSFAYRVI